MEESQTLKIVPVIIKNFNIIGLIILYFVDNSIHLTHQNSLYQNDRNLRAS